MSDPIFSLTDIATIAAATEVSPFSPMVHMDLDDGGVVPVMILKDDDDDEWIARCADVLRERYPNVVRLVVVVQVGHRIVATDLASGETAEVALP